MKIVKTNPHYRLYHMGFPVALRFEPGSDEFETFADSIIEATLITVVSKWLSERYGSEPYETWNKKNHPWCTTETRTATFFGLKDESVITALVLALNLEVVK